eukprot:scaffold5937_cov275-Pinguiococcus_pyrenoidosus.AAC.6
MAKGRVQICDSWNTWNQLMRGILTGRPDAVQTSQLTAGMRRLGIIIAAETSVPDQQSFLGEDRSLFWFLPVRFQVELRAFLCRNSSTLAYEGEVAHLLKKEKWHQAAVPEASWLFGFSAFWLQWSA